jgi:hypothetical protein
VESDEEHDGNITSVNKSPNLGEQCAVAHGPSMAAGGSVGSGQRAAGCGAKIMD